MMPPLCPPKQFCNILQFQFTILRDGGQYFLNFHSLLQSKYVCRYFHTRTLLSQENQNFVSFLQITYLKLLYNLINQFVLNI